MGRDQSSFSVGNPEEHVAIPLAPDVESDHVAVEGAHRQDVVDAKRDLS